MHNLKLIILILGFTYFNIAHGYGFEDMSPYPPYCHQLDCDIEIVSEHDIMRQPLNSPPRNRWVLYSRVGGQGSFAVGPGTPPRGVGSYHTNTPTGSNDRQIQLFNYDHYGTKLSHLRELSYWTYRKASSTSNPIQLPAINIIADMNGDEHGGVTFLVYEPYYTLDNAGGIKTGEWQYWDTFAEDAEWWSAEPIPGAPNRDTFVHLSLLIEKNPDAIILGIGINQGTYNPGLEAASDMLTLRFKGERCIAYDFEPS